VVTRIEVEDCKDLVEREKLFERKGEEARKALLDSLKILKILGEEEQAQVCPYK
jgi:hypothetical protein